MSNKSSAEGGSGKKQLLLTIRQENCKKPARKDEQLIALAVGSQAQDPPARIPKIRNSLGDIEEKTLKVNEKKPSSVSKDKNGKLKKTEEKVLKVNEKPSSGSKDKNVASNPAGTYSRCKQKNTAIDNFVPAGGSKSPALIWAEEVQSNLKPTLPSFIKTMVRSNVGGCFWMGLPRHICKAHLPNNDCTVILEDESEKLFEMKYLTYKRGLSAGWKHFCTAQQLLEGDVLVFQLVELYKFKVYVIRANNQIEVDVALGLLNLDAPEPSYTGSSKSQKRKHQNPLTLAPIKKKKKKNCIPEALKIGQTVEQSEDYNDKIGSEVLEGLKLSRPSLMFKDIESLGNFEILVGGVSIDLEIPKDVCIKYYRLCCSQNAFIHENCITGINSKLVIGAIIEIVHITDAIRTCKLTTTQHEFTNWDRTLKALEQLGINVRFLRARIHRLYMLAYESEEAIGARKYIETKTKLERTEKDIRSLQARLVELREDPIMFGDDIQSFEMRAESYELKFQEEILAFLRG